MMSPTMDEAEEEPNQIMVTHGITYTMSISAVSKRI